MSEERLKEIKDSIGLQANVMQIKHLDTTIIDEELELYNEVIRLREENKHLEDLYNQALKDYDELQQRIEKAIEYIEKYSNALGVIETIHNGVLLNILRGEDND